MDPIDQGVLSYLNCSYGIKAIYLGAITITIGQLLQVLSKPTSN